MTFFSINSSDYSNKEDQCLLECLYWYNYGSSLVSTNTTYKTTVDAVQFDKNVYELTSINCVQNNSDYQLEIIHEQIGGDKTLRVIIPFSSGGSTTLDLGNMSLDSIIPQEGYYYYYDKSDDPPTTHTIFFSGINRSFNLISEDSGSVGGLTSGTAISYNSTNDSRIFYNSSGTKNNNSYTTDDDIYIDCSPVGESTGDIIYTKDKTKLYFPSYKPVISSEHWELARGLAFGFVAIALFNKAFNKMV